MTQMLAKARNHFRNWRAWELNPVVVKELRQAVRSWSVTGMLLLFLAVLFCTALVLLVTQSIESYANPQVGGNIFRVFIAILTGASLLFIPLYVGVRLAAERLDSNLDLLYITTLTPARIIRGKFLCGAYMALLFFSACMPFMAFTNLLRGVDLPTVAFILVCLFAVVCVAIQAAIFCACLPISRLFKILVALFGVGWALPLIGSLTFGFHGMMQAGVGSMMGSRDFWLGFAMAAGIGLAITVLLYLLSVALISPPSANRALPLRAYVTGIWLIGLATALYWVFKETQARYIFAWTIPSLLIIALCLIVVVSNSDELSFRVRRAIPANPLKRNIALFFFNGAAGGLLWIGALTAVTLVTTHMVLSMALTWSPGASLDPTDFDEYTYSVIPTVFYVFAYALMALFVHRRFFSRRSPRLAGIFTVILPALLALAPNAVLFFTNRLSLRYLEATQLGNMFNIFMSKEPTQLYKHLFFSAGLLVVGLVLNYSWFLRQSRSFRPLEKWIDKPPPLPESVPPAMASGPQSS